MPWELERNMLRGRNANKADDKSPMLSLLKIRYEIKKITITDSEPKRLFMK